MKIQAIKQFTNGMTESEEASVILKENDNEVITLIWDRMMRHMDQVRTDELNQNYGAGRKRTKRNQADSVAQAAECSFILGNVAGKSAYFWRKASKQAIGFKYVSGWE